MRVALRLCFAGTLVGSLIALLGCSTTRTAVSHYVDPSHDLSIYRTWEWDEPRGPAEPELDAEIRRAIASELSRRGYQQADGHWPELRVRYRIALRREVHLYVEQSPATFVSSHHNAPSFEVGSSQERARVYETGSLRVRVDVPTEARSAWWALQSTRTRVSFARQVPSTIAAMFETFPAVSLPGIPSETTELDQPAERVAAAP